MLPLPAQPSLPPDPLLSRIVPEDLPFRHSCEGPDDMVSHSMVQSINVV